MVLLISACAGSLPGEHLTPAGVPRNQALYVHAGDGTGLAIDVWLPANLQPGQRIPALVQGSRYWRAMDATPLGRFAALLGIDAPGTGPDEFQRHFIEHGYAYVTVDARGTGASFGVHDTEYSRREMADYRAVLDWIVAQPWSSGRVGALGNSYAGTTAELMTTTGHPALQAAAFQYSSFDPQFQLVMPGGVHQRVFVSRWSALVGAMDQNDMCGVASAAAGGDIRGIACAVTRLVADGVKPVDGPEGERLLRAAVADHDSPNIEALLSSVEFRDSVWSPHGYTAMDALPYGRHKEVEASGVPLYVVTGWFDAASADGALARLVSLDNRQSVFIGPFSHGGDADTDPYEPADAPLVWSRLEQLRRLEAFFAAYLKNEGHPPAPGLRYYVLGAGRWKHTEVWPPAGGETRMYYLSGRQHLRTHPPHEPGEDTYRVDFDIGTAAHSRWMTQLEGADVIYRRRLEARGLLTYQTPPFRQDMELTGTPVLTLWLTSDRPQGALHVYLEDVAPDGTVRYLTEGILDLKHRRVRPGAPIYPTFGPHHSYLAADAEPMPVGEPQQVALGLYAISALIRRGHSLRIAIAGADAPWFARVPETGPPPLWTLHWGSGLSSRLEVPLRPWREVQPRQ